MIIIRRENRQQKKLGQLNAYLLAIINRGELGQPHMRLMNRLAIFKLKLKAMYRAADDTGASMSML